MKKLKFVVCGFACLLAFGCQTKKAQNTSVSATPMPFELKTEIDSVSFALGVLVANSLKNQGFTELDIRACSKGMESVQPGNTVVMAPEIAGAYVNDYVNKREAKKGQNNLEAGKAFLAQNAQRPGVVSLPSGLQYEVLTAGTGAIPTAESQVKVHYTGTLLDGTVFDSSVEAGEPIVTPVTGVIEGWVEALQLMQVGSKWKVYIPAELAYGAQSAGPLIGPNSTLIFEMELLEIVP
jgi:FKBP-type peptidyl-prolyl cis-trans isomerase FklB